jgi:hypothetical protein
MRLSLRTFAFAGAPRQDLRTKSQTSKIIRFFHADSVWTLHESLSLRHCHSFAFLCMQHGGKNLFELEETFLNVENFFKIAISWLVQIKKRHAALRGGPNDVKRIA